MPLPSTRQQHLPLSTASSLIVMQRNRAAPQQAAPTTRKDLRVIAPAKSIPDSPPKTPIVEDVLSELRFLNERIPQIVRLETREIQRTLAWYGVCADLATVESAVGWLVLDELEIRA